MRNSLQLLLDLGQDETDRADSGAEDERPTEQADRHLLQQELLDSSGIVDSWEGDFGHGDVEELLASDGEPSRSKYGETADSPCREAPTPPERGRRGDGRRVLFAREVSRARRRQDGPTHSRLASAMRRSITSTLKPP